MASVLWSLFLTVIFFGIVAFLGKVEYWFRSGYISFTGLSQLDRRTRLSFAVMFGLQIIGCVSIFMIGWFLTAATGALDIMDYDPPGLTESCNLLPIVFPLTLVTYLSYPKVKGRKWAKGFLIFIAILNFIFAIQLGIFLLPWLF